MILSSLWEKTYWSHIVTGLPSNYSNVQGLRRQGYLKLPQVEEVFVSYPFLRVSSLKAPVLPSKAYVMVDHTGEALHTMAVLQTYQVDLLKDLDQGED